MGVGKLPSAQELQDMLHSTLDGEPEQNFPALEKKNIELEKKLEGWKITSDEVDDGELSIKAELVNSLAEKLVGNIDQNFGMGAATNAKPETMSAEKMKEELANLKKELPKYKEAADWVGAAKSMFHDTGVLTEADMHFAYDGGEPLDNDGIIQKPLYYDLPMQPGQQDFAAGDHITVGGEEYLVTGKHTAMDTGKQTLKLQKIVNFTVKGIDKGDKVTISPPDSLHFPPGAKISIDEGHEVPIEFKADGTVEGGDFMYEGSSSVGKKVNKESDDYVKYIKEPAPQPAEGERGKMFAGIGKKKCP